MALRPIESISGLFDTDEGKLVGIFPTGTNDVSYLPTSETRVSGDPVAAVVDPLTGRVGFQVDGKGVLARNPLAPLRAVAIGDSITQSDNDNTARVTGNSWFEYLCHLSLGRIRRIYNAGISGNTTAQMLARLQADVIAYSPDVCFIQGGTNDAGLAVPIATTMSNIDSMCQGLLLAGIEPILCLIPPRSSVQSAVELINIRLVDYARRNGIRCIDAWRSMVSTSGGWANGSTYSTDGTHPVQKGAILAAQDALSQLTLPSAALWLTRNNADANGLLSNSLFVTDTNADGLPDSWIKYGATVTPSLVAGSGAVTGNWLQIAFSGITGIGVVERSIPLSGYSAGDKIALTGRFKTVGFEAGTAKFGVKLQFQGPNSSTQPISNMGVDMDGVFYQEATIPAGTTGMLLQLTPNSNGASGTGTLSVAQMQIYNLTALGIA